MYPTPPVCNYLQVNITVLIVTLDTEQRLKWVSGFSGSNGMAAITRDEGRHTNTNTNTI